VCEPAFRSRCLLVAQVSLCYHPWLTSNLLIRPVAESMSQRPFLMVPAMDPYCHPTLYMDLVDVLGRNTASGSTLPGLTRARASRWQIRSASPGVILYARLVSTESSPSRTTRPVLGLASQEPLTTWPLDSLAFHKTMTFPLGKPPRRSALVLAITVLVKADARSRHVTTGSGCAASVPTMSRIAIARPIKPRTTSQSAEAHYLVLQETSRGYT